MSLPETPTLFKQPTRFLFFGTPPFAANILEALLAADLRPSAVLSRPDAISKRGNAPQPSAVSNLAHEHGLPLLTPASLRDVIVQEQLAREQPELIIVAAYGLLLPPEVLALPTRGCINVHASLLPRWRGAAPVQRAILAGDRQTGISLMRMEAGLDTGPYCAQAKTYVADKNTETLTDELACMGARLLLDELPRLLAGSAVWTAQDETCVTYAQKVTKAELRLRPEHFAAELACRVRAANTSTPARLTLAERDAHVLSAQLITDVNLVAGEVAVDKQTVMLGCAGSDALALGMVKPAGKQPMSAADWLRGIPSSKNGGLLWE